MIMAVKIAKRMMSNIYVEIQYAVKLAPDTTLKFG